MAVELPLECLQCGRAHGLPGQLVPLPYCSNRQEAFPDVQPESGFLSLEPIIPCPSLWEDREEILALLGVTRSLSSWFARKERRERADRMLARLLQLYPRAFFI